MRRMSRTVGMLVGVIVCTLVAGGATLAGQANPCADDMKKLCAGVQPGGGKLLACMKEHESELSPQCQAVQKATQAKGQEFTAACKTDAEKLCKSVQPGGGRILGCLKQHQAELSPGCKGEMEGLGAKKGM